MDEASSITSALWVMVAIQTIGSVDIPGEGARKMPAPRAYVVIVVAMGILQLIADSGYSRAAKSMAWVTVLAAAVLGPFGPRAVNFLRNVSQNFAIPPQAAPGQPGQQATPTGSMSYPGVG